MADNTVYKLNNNNLFLLKNDKTSIFQNLFYKSKDNKLTTLNLQFTDHWDLHDFKKDERWLGTIIDLDWFMHLADKDFDFTKKQYDIEFNVQSQGHVI